MTSSLLWMTTVGWMTDQEVINYKLALAAAWLENGQERLARDIIRSIIEKAEGTNE
jgi:hypothetical protein